MTMEINKLKLSYFYEFKKFFVFYILQGENFLVKSTSNTVDFTGRVVLRIEVDQKASRTHAV